MKFRSTHYGPDFNVVHQFDTGSLFKSHNHLPLGSSNCFVPATSPWVLSLLVPWSILEKRPNVLHCVFIISSIRNNIHVHTEVHVGHRIEKQHPSLPWQHLGVHNAVWTLWLVIVYNDLEAFWLRLYQPCLAIWVSTIADCSFIIILPQRNLQWHVTDYSGFSIIRTLIIRTWTSAHVAMFSAATGKTLQSLEFCYKRKPSCCMNNFSWMLQCLFHPVGELDHDLQRPS